MPRSHPSTYDSIIQSVQLSDGLDAGSFDLCIPVIGFFESHGAFVFEQVPHAYSIHCVHRGRGIMSVAGTDYYVAAGDVFAFVPGCHVSYYDFPGEEWEYHWFNLDGNRRDWALSQLDLTPEYPLGKGLCTPQLTRHLQRTYSSYAQGKATPYTTVSAAWQMMDICLRRHTDNQQAAPDLAEAIKTWIDNRYMEDLTVAGMSARFKVERSTLFRKFKASYGISPKEYLDSVRMGMAQQLLTDTDLTIKEITYACGFFDQCYFSRIFTRKFGKSPSEWRRV